jgi:UDP-N-acetylglucosamine--N-acetylmuramyl-(pentapeptide) pyrophosphoryl-undecaprenol N-acetylglucosamine transferase
VHWLFVILLFVIAIAGLMAFAGRRWRRICAEECRVILTGGGTGGHVNPALAIAEGIRNREPNARFLYVGVKGKAESIIVGRAGHPLRFVTSQGFPGLRPSLRLIQFLVKLSVGVIQSTFTLLCFSPRWIIATGGYVSAPIISSALLLRLLGIAPAKLFLHEQNSIPGQLNAILGRWVDRVLLTFPQTLSFFPGNGVLVGYPVRRSITLKAREEAIAQLDFTIPDQRQVVFVFGGSQGARTINRAIVDALPFLLPHRKDLFIIHGMGLARSSDYDAVADTLARLEKRLSPEERALLKECYYAQDYFHNIVDIYSVSDLIVCRSGAGSLNEISRMGKPAFLIPKANLPGDHQVMNARAMKTSGATEILFEDTIVEDDKVLEKLDGQLLADRILKLLQDPGRLKQMGDKSIQFFRRHAVERILSELFGDHAYDNGTSFESVVFRPLLTNQQLLQRLTAAYSRSPRDYSPVTVIGDEDDLSYYRHRAAALLSHRDWQDRNLGVKLTGLTQYREKTPTLLYMLADRTPAGLLKRCLGGDFEQVAFIRRNIVQALLVMNHYDATIEKHLLIALEDPYFEVRTFACRAVIHFASHMRGQPAWIDAMLARLRDASFEVAAEAAKALGEIGTDEKVLEVLLELRESHYWQARNAALQGIHRLLERNAVQPSRELLAEVAAFVLTATDFKPHFSIKETYQSLQDCCQDKLTATTLADLHPTSSEGGKKKAQR